MPRESAAESIRRIARRFFRPAPPAEPAPSALAKNFLQIDGDGLRAIEDAIRQHYHAGWRSERHYSKEKYRADLDEHLRNRLESDRRTVIPWLDDAGTLRDRHILEIGCGTGSSTVALAEQGARVTAIDVDEGALRVAETRAASYGVKAEFLRLDATEIAGPFRGSRFDLIVYFACLEHMTIPERLASLADAWEMLPGGGLLAIVETPNRLWYFDGHTSLLPFFHWLPDDLAFAYARFSPRENFRELYGERNAASQDHFLRRGRGMSFHEIDVAIGPAGDLTVVSSLSTFEGPRYLARKSGPEQRYKSLLMSIHPGLHEGFFDDVLYLVLRK